MRRKVYALGIRVNEDPSITEHMFGDLVSSLSNWGQENAPGIDLTCQVSRPTAWPVPGSKVYIHTNGVRARVAVEKLSDGWLFLRLRRALADFWLVWGWR